MITALISTLTGLVSGTVPNLLKELDVNNDGLLSISEINNVVLSLELKAFLKE